MSFSFYHDFSRRDWLKISLASVFGVSYSGWLPKLAYAAAAQNKPKACIVLWMSGGPSQTDTFDLKPDHENGGPSKEIDTAVPGIRISEHLPGLARQVGIVGRIKLVGAPLKELKRGIRMQKHETDRSNQSAQIVACSPIFVAEGTSDCKPV